MSKLASDFQLVWNRNLEFCVFYNALEHLFIFTINVSYKCSMNFV